MVALAAMGRPSSAEELRARWPVLLQRLLFVGWGCLALSALCLYLSEPPAPGSADGEWGWAVLMMTARLAGTVGFAVGGVAIFNRRWFEGISMCLIAVILPLVSFFTHGTL